MNLINKEKEKIYIWALQNQSNKSLPQMTFDELEASNYFPASNVDNVIEYGFSNILELKEILEEKWKSDDVIKEIALTCAVATFRNKPVNRGSGQVKTKQEPHTDEGMLPDFIYVF